MLTFGELKLENEEIQEDFLAQLIMIKKMNLEQ